jgi:hypothetical protein
MKKLILLTGLFLIISSVAMATPIVNFASVQGAEIVFNGDPTHTFQFDNAGQFDFLVGSYADLTGDILGLFGNIDGVFTIATPVVGSSAPVTGTGSLKIHDGVGNDFTSDIVFNDIIQIGAYGGLNTFATINLTNIVYAGPNNDLNTLKADGQGVATISFQWAPDTKTLNGLATGGVDKTSYSGSLSTTMVPEPNSILLLGSGLVGLGFAVRRFKK